jgi:hypothetical protein
MAFSLPTPRFLPSPGAVVEISRYAVGQVVESAAAAATVPVRLFALLSQAELLVNRITLIAERAESLVERVDAVVAAAALTVEEVATVATGAATVVQGAATAVDGASVVIREAGTAAAEAQGMLDEYAPALNRAAPLVDRFVRELTVEEVIAAIRLIDELPRLRAHLTDDVMPLLGKLDQVGPDLHALLEVTNDLNLAVAGIPGLKMLRRRGEDRIEKESENGQ